MERSLTRFIRALRSAGAEVSSTEAIDAARTVALVGYADREVKDLLGVLVEQDDDLINSNQSSQAGKRRWVKKNFYARSPLFLRAFLYFLMRYIIGLGFLDGMQGLIFHFLQGFWYRFLVDAKIYEITRNRK